MEVDKDELEAQRAQKRLESMTDDLFDGLNDTRDSGDPIPPALLAKGIDEMSEEELNTLCKAGPPTRTYAEVALTMIADTVAWALDIDVFIAARVGAGDMVTAVGVAHAYDADGEIVEQPAAELDKRRAAARIDVHAATKPKES